MKGMALKMKNPWIQKSRMLTLSVMLLTIWICSCSTLPFGSSEEALRKRVEGMMNAKINDNWEEVYAYLDPVYRNKTPEKTFINFNREMAFKKYSIVSIEIQPSGTEAIVKVKQDLNVKIFDFKDQLDTQNWIKDGFTWYLKVN
ncbi:MAG: hypothetical protein MUE70_02135 [Desulfobacterales bacterium]|jgi:hypothetical protein|nr:hypothetical protein [Desulfobacterales bacterium]